MADKTLCMDDRQDFGIHNDVHNLFGWSEAEPTLAYVLISFCLSARVYRRNLK